MILSSLLHLTSCTVTVWDLLWVKARYPAMRAPIDATTNIIVDIIKFFRKHLKFIKSPLPCLPHSYIIIYECYELKVIIISLS